MIRTVGGCNLKKKKNFVPKFLRHVQCQYLTGCRESNRSCCDRTVARCATNELHTSMGELEDDLYLAVLQNLLGCAKKTALAIFDAYTSLIS